jgi:transcriptional/translational regulatory protein YebC/TACO1
MAGHSKWSKVKHFKGALNVKRGKLFSRLSKKITVAAKLGGGDLQGNARLRSAVSGQNMPNDVQNVYANFDLPEDLLARISA